MLAASKISDQRRMIDLPVNLGQQLAVLADEVGFDLQAERQIAAVAQSRRSCPVGRPLAARASTGRSPWGDKTRSRGSAWSRKRGPARRPFSLRRSEYFLNGTKRFFVPSSLSSSFTLPMRRAERRHVQAVFVFQVADFGDLRLRELHHVLDALAGVDEAERIDTAGRGPRTRRTAARRSFGWPLRRQSRRG